MDSITRPLILQLKKTANFIVLEGGEQGVLLVRPYTNDICSHWRFVNESIARKSANKSTPCFMTIRSNRILLEWIWQGSFLKWDLLAPAGMQIILVGKSTLEMVPYLRRQPHYTVKSPVLQAFSKNERQSTYDETYQTMRKEWRASEY